jgi:hypothetical protein
MKMPRSQRKTIERIKESPEEIYCSRSKVGSTGKDKQKYNFQKVRSALPEKSLDKLV